MATVSGAASIEITPVHQPGDSQAGGSVLGSCVASIFRRSAQAQRAPPAKTVNAQLGGLTDHPGAEPIKVPLPPEMADRCRGFIPCAIFHEVAEPAFAATPPPSGAATTQEARKKTPRWFFHRTAGQVVPRQHHAARKGDAPREDARLRSARCAEPGRLDARLSPRALRNPAPLARRPPMLTHPEGRRSR